MCNLFFSKAHQKILPNFSYGSIPIFNNAHNWAMFMSTPISSHIQWALRKVGHCLFLKIIFHGFESSHKISLCSWIILVLLMLSLNICKTWQHLWLGSLSALQAFHESCEARARQKGPGPQKCWEWSPWLRQVASGFLIYSEPFAAESWCSQTLSKCHLEPRQGLFFQYPHQITISVHLLW